jgi:hypothetical protein
MRLPVGSCNEPARGGLQPLACEEGTSVDPRRLPPGTSTATVPKGLDLGLGLGMPAAHGSTVRAGSDRGEGDGPG